MKSLHKSTAAFTGCGRDEELGKKLGNDYTSEIFPRSFANEQVGEKDNTGSIVDQLKPVKGPVQVLFRVKKKLVEHVFVPP